MTNRKPKKVGLSFGIWGDPLGWGRGVGNNRLHVFFWSLFHILVILPFMIFANISTDTPKIISTLTMPTLFFGGVYPCFYVYVIYRLIRMIDEKDADGPQE